MCMPFLFESFQKVKIFHLKHTFYHTEYTAEYSTAQHTVAQQLSKAITIFAHMHIALHCIWLLIINSCRCCHSMVPICISLRQWCNGKFRTKIHTLHMLFILLYFYIASNLDGISIFVSFHFISLYLTTLNSNIRNEREREREAEGRSNHVKHEFHSKCRLNVFDMVVSIYKNAPPIFDSFQLPCEIERWNFDYEVVAHFVLRWDKICWMRTQFKYFKLSFCLTLCQCIFILMNFIDTADSCYIEGK